MPLRSITGMITAILVITASATSAQQVGQVCWPEIAGESLKVCLQPQLRATWCWAASAQMIMTFLIQNPQQFDQAELASRGYSTICPTSNCFPGPPSPCDDRGLFPDFTALDSRFKFEFVPRSLTWDELKSEIGAHRPVAFSWCWRAPGNSQQCDPDPEKDSGHFMVLAGIGSIDANVVGGKKSIPAVRVLQPLCCCQGDKGYFTYEEYRQGNGHRHWRDYYCIRATDTACIKLPTPEPSSAFEPDAPAFAGPRPAAEATRSAWLPDIASVWERGLGIITPKLNALGEAVPALMDAAVNSTATMLADEIPVWIVLPQELAESSDDVTLDDVKHDAGIRLFPLQAISTLANTPWLSTLEVRQGVDAKWRLASVGRPLHAEMLFHAWQRAHTSGLDTPLVEVRFLGLNTSFLVPIDRMRRLDVFPICGTCLRLPMPEEKLPLEDALKRLREAAKSYRGGPS
jgi:papain like cysteine protease AvrRpt2